MTRYRKNLPQLQGGLFLSDGGMETALIFLQGAELPHFASFVLLASEDGRAKLTEYYESFLPIARQRKTGFVLDTATWRANPDWAPLLGYDLPALKAANEAAVELGARLRGKWETPGSPIVLNGAIGPRGDGYKAGRMEADEAEDYHSFQVGVFAGTEADMVSAITMNTVNEAIGIARAAKAHDMPCVVSFTVETDGRLVDGTSLREAVERTDEATGLLHDQLRAPQPFRAGIEARGSLDRPHLRHPRQRLSQKPRRAGRVDGARCWRPGRSQPALSAADRRISFNEGAGRLLRYRPPPHPRHLRGGLARCGGVRRETCGFFTSSRRSG
jgi:S-methylmethionine-dependent homocysteine/selenocysteine methylase